MDNMIAAKKVKPMIVVMPAGHTTSGTSMALGTRAAAARDPFLDDFEKGIMPDVEK